MSDNLTRASRIESILAHYVDEDQLLDKIINEAIDEKNSHFDDLLEEAFSKGFTRVIDYLKPDIEILQRILEANLSSYFEIDCWLDAKPNLFALIQGLISAGAQIPEDIKEKMTEYQARFSELAVEMRKLL
jgi:hypothetical protein